MTPASLLVSVLLAAGPSPYRLAATWEGFKEPMGVAAAGDIVYVAEAGGRRVVKLDAQGRPAGELGEPGAFKRPVDVAVAPDGTVYVCDLEADKVLAFSPEGRVLSSWGRSGAARGEFEAPSGLAVDARGQVYVAEFYNGRVQVLDAAGKWIRSLGRKGGGKGEFNYPTDAAVDRDGNVLVADAYNHRLQKLSPEGKVLAVWGSRAKRFFGGSGALRVPTSAAWDSAGRVHVADSANRRVVLLSAEGRMLGEWKLAGDKRPGVHSPGRLAVSGERVLVADTANGRVLVLEVSVKEERAADAPKEAARKVIVRVEGLACPFCVYGLERQLNRLKGVESAEVDLGGGKATLTLEPGAKVGAAEIKKAVRKAGFKASEVKGIEPAQ